MKVETNCYANTCIESNPSCAWPDTTVEELKAFIGVLILMGIVRLPRLELGQLISPSSSLTPGISNIMPPKKFEQLFRFFST